MNPRITDLLDDYVDTSVQLLPPEQVLRGTSSVPKTPTVQKPVHHRMKKPLVIAAALLLAFTGIAAASLRLFGGSNSGDSLNTGLPEAPDSTQWSTPEPDSGTEEFFQEDIVLDDTNSVIVTSEATGLSMRVPTEYQDGLKTDDSFTLTTIYSDDESFDFDSIFTFCDTSNQDSSHGIVFSIDAWDQSGFDAYLSDPTIGQTFELNSAIVGKKEASYYRMLQFGNSLSTRFPHFDAASLDSARAYYARLQYAIPMVNSFIELNGLDPVETGLDSWDELFRQRMLEPMADAIRQLEAAQNPAESETAANAQKAQYARAYGFDAVPDNATLIAFLGLPVAYGNGEETLLALTYDVNTHTYAWVFQCSVLAAQITSDSQNSTQQPEFIDEYHNEIAPILNDLIVKDAYFVYLDGTQSQLEIGSQISYLADGVFTDRLEPTEHQDEIPSYVEIDGTAYAFSLSGASFDSTTLRGDLQAFSGLTQNELWLDPTDGQYTWVIENTELHSALLAASPSGSYKEAQDDPTFAQALQTFHTEEEEQFQRYCTLIYSDGTALPLTGGFSWSYERGSFLGTGTLAQCEKQTGITPDDAVPAYLLVNGSIVPLTTNTQGDVQSSQTEASSIDDLHSTMPVGNENPSTTLTSSTGLSLAVMPDCVDAGEFYVDDTITLENQLSCNIDVVFAAFDQRNLNSGGFLWAIIDGSPKSMPLDLPDGYQWDVMGQLDGETYSIIMPTADNLQFDENSLTDVTSYNNHAIAANWCLTRITAVLATNTEDPDWLTDYAGQVIAPVANRYSELEYARQDSLQPSDSSLNLPAAQDTDGDGLLTAELNIPVETEYGTAILQKFTLDPSSLEFSWYTDLSDLSGSFAEYGSDLSTVLKEHEEFQVEFSNVFNAVQEVILDSMLVYPDNSHVCLSTGERNDYGTQSLRTFDTLGLATKKPTSDEHPSCLEIGGITYSLS